MEKKLNVIEEKLDYVITLVQGLNKKIDDLEKKVDDLDKKIEDTVMNECQKMGSHIDFIENVYENVKNPLGYICKKVDYFSGKQYELTNN